LKGESTSGADRWPRARDSRHAAPVIAVTSGEPAGIGPDICLALARHALGGRVVVLGDRALLEERARRIGIDVRLRDAGAVAPHAPDSLAIVHVPLAVPCVAGAPDPRNGAYVIALLERAIAGCSNGEFAAMATAPVHKSIINDAGIPFVGHTEFLAERTGTARVVMMLEGGGLRVALATTHLALKDVPGALTRGGLEDTVRVLCAGLTRFFGLASPRVLVAGLNPHGGESGYFGREEIEIIGPVLDKLRAQGLRLTGPLPADTLFTPVLLANADCVLAMYHDQGLPVLKYASFGKGINVTLGLPIIRTSVDHGTALELAGSGKADPGSLIAAVEAAIGMASSALTAAATAQGPR
jgi:4-hydroxythreonine-4-phosphate dehydrogenase